MPDRDGVREIIDLARPDRTLLLDESCRLSEYLVHTYKGDKLNVAAIGNLVPQLHLHHVVRFKTDRAWPSPVWGRFPAVSYSGQRWTTSGRNSHRRISKVLNREPLINSEVHAIHGCVAKSAAPSR
ncbi:MAG: diadenosine tetraphosphate hydrolase [Lysobacterales bacterium]